MQRMPCRWLIALLATVLLVVGGGWWRSYQEGEALTLTALQSAYRIFGECLYSRGLEIEGLEEVAAGRRQPGELPRLTATCSSGLEILARADTPHRADLWRRAEKLFRSDNLHLDALAAQPGAEEELAAIRKQYQALHDMVRSWRPDQPLAAFLNENEQRLAELILDLTR